MADIDGERERKGFQLKLVDGGQVLVAWFDPAAGVTLDEAALRRAIAERGYEIDLVDPAITAFVERQQQATEPFTLPIAGHRDAQFCIEIDKDELAAYAVVAPAFGRGLPLSKESVETALHEAGVVAGIIDSVLAELAGGKTMPLLTEEQGRLRMLVAEGRAPHDGSDGYLESLFPDAADRRPRVRDNGRVDYRDRGEIVVVNPGEAFVRRRPPTAGEDGFTVTGHTLGARDGQPIDLRPIDRSAEVSREDGDVLVATIAGQPVILPSGAKVEPILRVDEVALSSGNVIYDGTVVVKGDVHGGMKIEATGDIKVGGVIEGARVTAAGDVIVNGGIIGRGSVRDTKGALRPEAAAINAHGVVSARFIENAYVDAGGDVLVRDLIRHSEVTSVSRVLVGAGNPTRGQIIGGVTKARHLVQTAVLGAPASVHTTVEVGNRAELRKRIRDISDELRQQQERLQKVEAAVVQLKKKEHSDEATLAKFAQARRQLQSLVEKLQAERERLDKESMEAVRGQIVAGKKVYNNVHVIIDGRSRTVEEERNSVTFVLEGGTIAFR